MDLGFKDATVVVSGGTAGMGRAAADCFAADGAKVAVLARSKAALDATVEELSALGSPDAVGIQTDLFDAGSVDAALAQVGERWGQLNALVNAAGPMAMNLKTFETYTDEEWHSVLSGLTLSAVRTIRAALPLLRAARWARIVNVSAMSTKRQSPPLIAYTAAKSALTSLSKNLSQTLAPEGILVNTVSPGTFASESFKQALAPIPDVDENDLHDVMRYIGRGFGHHVFLGRAADPAEIGPVIAFAASARNTYMTGANINVDGGSDFA
ncbi:SDR family NAD(P)-dependent oxidoreductase [Pseudofrankia inefficax]|uniref:Short-chain dehydrogenase/reductase SDR n=1 Tax=Pseudofrankia inefficax (strain DSM 45817 / CECT 9037 / DDB 130130 / EuI1c) TaxID=298654 RepID=E3IVF9_PSEI1|nr:SDR family oxidoreductase [Pseudofrankia inefficax]ADP81323.1 short-chain dehydrogenase/reductase SDR [Pseudofrankia inefficax]